MNLNKEKYIMDKSRRKFFKKSLLVSSAALLVQYRTAAGSLENPVWNDAYEISTETGDDTAFAREVSSPFYNIRDYGAVGDGLTVNTSSIQQAIDTCSKNGGGKVLISGGAYVTGTIFMKDNVTLLVEEDGILLGSPHFSDYSQDVYRCMYKGETHLNLCLIFSKNVKNIGFEGNGVIDGQGHKKYWDQSSVRPMMFRFLNCRGIHLRNLTLLHPGGWTTAFLYSEDIKVTGLTIHSWANGNGDGLNFDGCRNVIVSDCNLNNGDDCICLMTSRRDRPCENVVVTNCVMSSRWAAVRIGLLSAGDIRDVTMSNCVMKDVFAEGIKIQMCEGATIENININNIVMRNLLRPIYIAHNNYRISDYEFEKGNPLPPMEHLRNIQISNIQAYTGNDVKGNNGAVIAVIGLPEGVIENVSFSNIYIRFPGGGSREIAYVEDFPEFRGKRPEFPALRSEVPAYGLYGKNIKGLTLNNVRFEVEEEDARAAVFCDDVEDIVISGLKADTYPEARSVIGLKNSKNVLIQGCSTLGKGKTFLSVKGDESVGISMLANDLGKIEIPFLPEEGAEGVCVHQVGNLDNIRP